MESALTSKFINESKKAWLVELSKRVDVKSSFILYEHLSDYVKDHTKIVPLSFKKLVHFFSIYFGILIIIVSISVSKSLIRTFIFILNALKKIFKDLMSIFIRFLRYLKSKIKTTI